ncbi:MAG TPA: FISUMP domain-containing protein [Fibrobacteria bacterium]|nr:FISUMP domain-containing protein [Fibrobacteria bacterium]
MKFNRPSLRSIATVAAGLFALVACQNATDSNSNADSPVVATVSFPIAAPRVPDSAAWIFQKDTVGSKPNCSTLGGDTTSNCTETFDLPQPLGSDSVALQLWTLGIQTYTLYFKETGRSTTLTRGSAAVDSPDTLLLSLYAKLPAAQKSALVPVDSGRAGLVAFYAGLLLAGNATFAGKPLPVGLSADSVQKDLVYLGLAQGKTATQLASLDLGLDTSTIRTIAAVLVQQSLLKSSDTLDWFHPVRISGTGSVAGTVLAGGSPVNTTGSFLWNTGVKVSLAPIAVHNSRGVDDSDFHFPTKQFAPGASDTSWSLSGNLSIQATASATAGWDTLVVTLSSDSTHWATLRIPFQVVAKDVTPPGLVVLSPVGDTATVPNSTGSYAIQAVATDSGSGVDSLKVGSATLRTSGRLSDTLRDTVPLVVGANVVSVQAWDHAGNTSTTTVSITRGPAPANTKPPTITLVSPVQDTGTVPWGTKSAILSWAITGDTTLTSVTVTGHPLSAHAGLYQDTTDLAVGPNLFALSALDAHGLVSYDTVRIIRQADTTHPLVSRGLGTEDTVLLQTQSTFAPAWRVTDNALDSVTIDGTKATAGIGNAYSVPVTLSGDSLWITLVAVDSSGNTARDSVKVRRLALPTITPAGGTLSGTQTVIPQISSNLPGATLSYSTSANPSVWTVGTSPFVSTNQVLRAKATVGNLTSIVDSVVFLYIPTGTLSGITANQATVTVAPAGSDGIEDSLSPGSTWTSYSGPFPVSGNTKVYLRSHLGGSVTAMQEVDFAVTPSLSPSSKDTGVDSVVVSVSRAGADSVQVSLNQQKWSTLAGASPSYAMASNGTLYGRSWVGNAVSSVDSANVQIYPSAPLFSLSSSTYPFAQTVRLTAIPAGANIHYTTDGSTPTLQSALYADSIVVGTSKTLKAIAANGSAVNGSVDSATFWIADTNTYGIPWNRSITYGTLMDARDSQIYRTVKIGTQTWMAQNLGFNVANTSFCYNDSASNCRQFGRLYSTAMSGPPACPTGWHVPNDSEWTFLLSFAGSATPGRELKSTTGWDSSGAGQDSIGFRAVPGGDGEVLSPSAASGSGKGSTGFWWSTTSDVNSGHEYFWSLSSGTDAMSHSTTRDYECSIRCLQDP